jgi:hypothetical protein
MLTLQVSLGSAAQAADGSDLSASVAANGGNKVKLKKGVALFRDVVITAEQAGSYVLRVAAASRKVAVADATLHLIMQPLNAVSDLRVLLPGSLEAGECAAGTSTVLHVQLLTENGLSLPPEVAAKSLTLKVTPPGGQPNGACRAALCSLSTAAAAGKVDSSWESRPACIEPGLLACVQS